MKPLPKPKIRILDALVDVGEMSVTLAIDPGVTTGVAASICGSYYTFPTKDPNDLFRLIFEYKHCIQYVVYEEFSTAGRVDHNMLKTIRVVGGIVAVCYLSNVIAVKHYPGFRASFMNEAKRILVPGTENGHRKMTVTVHELDALGHLLYFEKTGR